MSSATSAAVAVPVADTLVHAAMGEPPKGEASQAAAKRSRFVLLQALVVIVLSYQLLFSRNAMLPAETQQLFIVALLLTIVVLMFLPVHVLRRNWFIGALVVADTALTTACVYLAGHAGSDLYITYFLIILIAALTTSLRQLIGLSCILCAAYGAILYLEVQQTGSLATSHLLRIPVLLIMAIFYGEFAEMVRQERGHKAGLMDHITTLEQAEEERERLIRELQDALANIKTLNGLLPICCSCKQIRDDKGYWSQIETYIRNHTDADFTHGICPACSEKLYPLSDVQP